MRRAGGGGEPPPAGAARAGASRAAGGGRPPPAAPDGPERAVLFGWLGAEARVLDKYTRAWEEVLGGGGGGRRAGLAPLRSVTALQPRTRALLAPSLFLPGELDRLEAALWEGAPPAGPPGGGDAGGAPLTVYHLFSMAGFLAFSELARQGRLAHPAVRPAGLVLDCTPARLDAEVASRGLLAGALGVPLEGWRGRAAVAGARPLVGMWLASGPGARAARARAEAWEPGGAHSDCTAVPQLYLYSPADAVIPPAEVEAFAAAQARRPGAAAAGGGARRVRWPPGAPHCALLRAAPAAYRAELARLLALARLRRPAPSRPPPP